VVIVSLTVVVWPIFPVFSSSTLDPNLHNSVALSKTRVPQPCSSSSSAQVAGCSGHDGRRCSARDLHAPESLLFFGERDGHAPLSLATHSAG
jgi:hypothetical protein